MVDMLVALSVGNLVLMMVALKAVLLVALKAVLLVEMLDNLRAVLKAGMKAG